MPSKLLDSILISAVALGVIGILVNIAQALAQGG